MAASAQLSISWSRPDVLPHGKKPIVLGKTIESEPLTHVWKWRKNELSGRIGKTWGVWNTALMGYAGIDLDGYLTRRVGETEREGARFRILDVGLGSGWQWKEFLEAHPGIEFLGIALTLRQVIPEMRGRVKLCTAGRLERHFPSEYFDLIVSHYGMHFQTIEAFPGIVRLLKPGGEAIACGGSADDGPDVRFPGHEKQYEVLATREWNARQPEWFYHIRKR